MHSCRQIGKVITFFQLHTLKDVGETLLKIYDQILEDDMKTFQQHDKCENLLCNFTHRSLKKGEESCDGFWDSFL